MSGVKRAFGVVEVFGGDAVFILVDIVGAGVLLGDHGVLL